MYYILLYINFSVCTVHCTILLFTNPQNGLAGTHMTFSIIPSENSALNVAALEVSKELVTHSWFTHMYS